MLQASPSAAVGPPAGMGEDAICVNPVAGVFTACVALKEIVGSAPDVVGDAPPARVGRAKVGRLTGVSVEAGVDVG